MEEQTQKSSKGKRFEGMGFMPFFEDYNVFRSMKLIASQDNQRIGSLILGVVKNYYLEQMKQPLNVNSPTVFHEQIKEASKKKGTKGVADYIEYCCSKWVEKEFPKRFMPEIKRG